MSQSFLNFESIDQIRAPISSIFTQLNISDVLVHFTVIANSIDIFDVVVNRKNGEVSDFITENPSVKVLSQSLPISKLVHDMTAYLIKKYQNEFKYCNYEGEQSFGVFHFYADGSISVDYDVMSWLNNTFSI